uniref:Cystatin n=1 Tax=Ficus pumila var. awkeotsang TaxID=204231 RepID=D0VMS3_FICPW|nr:cystatin [Ficus pumila var. awkeotsang]
MRPHCLLVILAVLLVPLAAKKTGPLTGKWWTIKNLNAAHVKEIADFAVSEHNKQSKASLKLTRIVSGETQVVAGTNYRLILAVTNKKAVELYEAVVWEKEWEHFRNLTSFTLVN